jgi:hypothetical protein
MEERTASIFKAKSNKRPSWRRKGAGRFGAYVLFDCTDGGSRFFRNISGILRHYMAPYFRRQFSYPQLWKFEIKNRNVSIIILEIVHPSVVYLKHDVSETGFCLRLEVIPTQLSPIDRASIWTSAPTPNRVYNTNTTRTNNTRQKLCPPSQ